jgi:hypothetical protein
MGKKKGKGQEDFPDVPDEEEGAAGISTAPSGDLGDANVKGKKDKKVSKKDKKKAGKAAAFDSDDEEPGVAEEEVAPKANKKKASGGGAAAFAALGGSDDEAEEDEEEEEEAPRKVGAAARCAALGAKTAAPCSAMRSMRSMHGSCRAVPHPQLGARGAVPAGARRACTPSVLLHGTEACPLSLPPSLRKPKPCSRDDPHTARPQGVQEEGQEEGGQGGCV